MLCEEYRGPYIDHTFSRDINKIVALLYLITYDLRLYVSMPSLWLSGKARQEPHHVALFAIFTGTTRALNKFII